MVANFTYEYKGAFKPLSVSSVSQIDMIFLLESVGRMIWGCGLDLDDLELQVGSGWFWGAVKTRMIWVLVNIQMIWDCGLDSDDLGLWVRSGGFGIAG